MSDKYLWLIIFLLAVTIIILAYVNYQNDRKIKAMQRELIDLQEKPKNSGRPLIFDRNTSAYTSTETRNYYRSATIPERKWQKVGVLTAQDKTLNLLARPTTYNEDIWQFRVEDKDGFIIELPESQPYRTGQVIESIPGKASAGPWTVRIYSRDTYYL